MRSSSPFSRSAPAGLRDADDVSHPDEDMNDSESRDEAPDKGIPGQHADGEVRMQQRIERPQPRPGDDEEEESRLQAVEGEEEGNAHSKDCNGSSKFEVRMKNEDE